MVYPDLLYCTTVQYPGAFSSSRNVRVIASVSHEKDSVRVHDSAVVWTSDVTQRSFRVCVLESGPGTNGSAVVNWIAFRGAPSGMLDGAASFSTFTSGTKCERVNFPQVCVQLCSCYDLILYSESFLVVVANDISYTLCALSRFYISIVADSEDFDGGVTHKEIIFR